MVTPRSFALMRLRDRFTREKCLVCIICQVRAGDLTWESFKKFVLDRLGADLALCVGRDKDNSREGGYYRHAKYIWEYNEPHDYVDAFDYVKKKLNSNQDWRLLLKVKNQWLGGILGAEAHSGSAAILIFYRWLLAKKILENGLLNKYGRFILTRSDYLYCAPHPSFKQLSPDNIWLPSGEDYGGYTDRHLIASNKDIIKCINLIDDIILRPTELYENMRYKKRWNLEKYIAYHMRTNGLESKIKRFPRVMFAVRGDNDNTRWAAGSYAEELKLVMMYQSELDECRADIYKIIRRGNGCRRVLSYNRLFLKIKADIKRTLFTFLGITNKCDQTSFGEDSSGFLVLLLKERKKRLIKELDTYRRSPPWRLPQFHEFHQGSAVLKSNQEYMDAFKEAKDLGLVPLADYAPMQKAWDNLVILSAVLSNTRRDAVILDAGPIFYSKILPWLAAYGYKNLTGIGTVLKKKMKIKNILYECGNLTHTNLKSNFFDAITCIDLTNHGIESDLFLQEMSRILKPGGLLIISANYWPSALKTKAGAESGLRGYIFDREDMLEFISLAKKHGFGLDSDIKLDAQDATIGLFKLRFTFIYFVLRKNKI